MSDNIMQKSQPFSHSSNLILIVDDTPTNLKVLAKTLTNSGLEVAVATNGEMALQQVEYDPPELILLDILMPGIDGFETCKALKADPSTQDIPIIFMTALSDTVDKVKGLSLGAVDYIIKPFEEEEVLARVHIHLQLQTLTKTLAKKNQELAQALEQIQVTQQQLITQERLAIIGTLMTGVAHELRNPLNFINNYAECSVELADELFVEFNNQLAIPTEESQKMITEIIQDIKENAIIIQQQGQRADEVIQNLLMQARIDRGQTQRKDLNSLLDQSIQLACKSQWAQNIKLPIQIITDYDQTIGSIEMIPADLSRAFINLAENACYALQTRFNPIQNHSHGPTELTPSLWIKTHNQDQTVVIEIRDNGCGIPTNIKDKIFNPFFTTKPTGEGTGLGLSLTRDILVDQHRGTITVETEPGRFTQFTIILPKTLSH